MNINTEKRKKLRWLKKLGIIGIAFFLLKGLVWIGIATFAWIKLKG